MAAPKRPLKTFFGGKGATVLHKMLAAAHGDSESAKREFYATINAERKGSAAQRAVQPSFAPGTLPKNVHRGGAHTR